MAIRKNFIHFQKKKDFETEVGNNSILDTSIVFIQESREISTHGVVYKSVNWGVLDSGSSYSSKKNRSQV